MRRPLVMGNWKMNGSSLSNEALMLEIVAKAKDTDSIDIAVCPPTLYLPQVIELCRGSSVRVGCQNMSDKDSGAFTGEVSASMLKDLTVSYVLVGHSERRTLFAETDSDVAAKVEKALEIGVIPVLCVGETLAERKSGVMKEVISKQIQTVLDRCSITAFAQIVVAYEPVWAIGTGETATPAQAQEVHAYIRSLLGEESPQIAERCTLLYGGSVNEKNAQALFSMDDVDGGLVGGASLKAESFNAICRAAAESL